MFTYLKRRGLAASIAALTALVVALSLAVLTQNGKASASPPTVTTTVQTPQVAQLAAAVAPQVTAPAPVPLRLRQHLNVDGWPFGYYSVTLKGHTYWLICLYITGSVPELKTLRPVAVIGDIIVASGKKYRVGPEKTAELLRVEDMVKRSDTAHRAAVLYMAANLIAGIDARNFTRISSHAPKTVRTAAHSIVNNVAEHHGKSAASLKLTRAPQHVGDTGAVTMTVLNNSAGKKVTFSATGGTMLKTVARTNQRGQASATFLSTSRGGTVTATAHGLNPVTILVGNRTRYKQVMISRGPLINLSKSVKFSSQRTSLSAKCLQPCDGTNVQVTGSRLHNPTGSSETAVLTAQRVVNGKLTTVNLGKVTVPAHQAKTPTWRAHDRDKNLVETVTVNVGGRTHRFVVATLRVVDCPPEMQYMDAHTVNCTKCTTFVVTPLGTNKAATTVTFTYSDSLGHHASFQVAPGQSHAPVSVTVNAAQYSYTVVESVPYATHSGARTLTDSGTVTVTAKG